MQRALILNRLYKKELDFVSKAEFLESSKLEPLHTFFHNNQKKMNNSWIAYNHPVIIPD